MVEKNAAPAVSYLVISRWVDKLKKKKSPFSHSHTHTLAQAGKGKKKEEEEEPVIISMSLSFSVVSFIEQKKKKRNGGVMTRIFPDHVIFFRVVVLPES